MRCGRDSEYVEWIGNGRPQGSPLRCHLGFEINVGAGFTPARNGRKNAQCEIEIVGAGFTPARNGRKNAQCEDEIAGAGFTPACNGRKNAQCEDEIVGAGFTPARNGREIHPLKT